MAAALLLSPGAYAQYDTAAPQDYPTPAPADREWTDDEIPAHLAIVDGDVTLERDGRVEPADENIILLAGDRLRTARGRTEVLYSDGSALDLDQQSTVDLMSDALVRLLEGRVRLSIARGAPSLDYRVDTAAGSVFLRSAGDYRITLATRGAEPELDLAVLRGSAELANEYGRTLVRAGSHALVTARTAPSLPFPANSASWDTFDRWVEDQRDARLGVQSTRYLPAELSYYGGAFDQYGTWGYEPVHGNVWYPTVSHDWRPYSHGRWSFVGHFGWVWIGVGRWSWATHHYGRWGYRNRWYWIPGRRWSPAWVSWAYAPGYVSWCPLGWDNRPVFSFTNIHITRIDPWIGWTVLPRHSFRPNVIVTRYIVPRHTVTPSLWSQFAVQRTAPTRPVAVRDVQPLRAPTARGYAVPRDGLLRGAAGGDNAPAARTGAAAPRGIAGASPGTSAGSRSAPTTAGARRSGVSGAPRASAPDGGASASTPSRAQPRATSPASTERPLGTIRRSREPVDQPASPSRAIRTREPAAQPPASTPSRAIPSRAPVDQRPAPSAPSRTIRSREPAAPPPASAPSRAIRSREPIAPSVQAPTAPRGRSRAPRVDDGAPGSTPRVAPRAAPPTIDRAPSASPWMRSRPGDPGDGGAARGRSGPSRVPSPAPSASRPSGGWGSAPPRVAPRSRPDSPPPASAGPPRGGGERRAPAAPSQGSGRSGAVRRGGGR